MNFLKVNCYCVLVLSDNFKLKLQLMSVDDEEKASSEFKFSSQYTSDWTCTLFEI